MLCCNVSQYGIAMLDFIVEGIVDEMDVAWQGLVDLRFYCMILCCAVLIVLSRGIIEG